MKDEDKEIRAVIIPGSPNDPYHTLSLRILTSLDRYAEILVLAQDTYWATVGREISGTNPDDHIGLDITDVDVSQVAEAWGAALRIASTEYRHACHQAAIELTSRIMYAIGAGDLQSEHPNINPKGGPQCQSKYD